jgi:hypothetical protein
VTIEFATLGTGFSVFDRLPDVLFGLGVLSAFLWLFWLDHVSQIHKIALYIGARIAPRLRQYGSPGLLGWEQFLREIDSGKIPQFKSSRFLSTRNIFNYIALLFGGTPIAMIVLAIASFTKFDEVAKCLPYCPPSLIVMGASEYSKILRLAMVVIVSIIWLVAVSDFVRFRRGWKAIQEAFIAGMDEKVQSVDANTAHPSIVVPPSEP